MKLNYVSAISVLSLMLVCTSSFALPKNECKNGFVWREAVSNDYVCVTPEARDTAKIQNRNAHANRNPKGGAFGNDTCKQGFVWREVVTSDHVCVTPNERTDAVQQNQQHCQHARKCTQKK